MKLLAILWSRVIARRNRKVAREWAQTRRDICRAYYGTKIVVPAIRYVYDEKRGKWV
jgi:hypothetical protein